MVRLVAIKPIVDNKPGRLDEAGLLLLKMRKAAYDHVFIPVLGTGSKEYAETYEQGHPLQESREEDPILQAPLEWAVGSTPEEKIDAVREGVSATLSAGVRLLDIPVNILGSLLSNLGMVVGPIVDILRDLIPDIVYEEGDNLLDWIATGLEESAAKEYDRFGFSSGIIGGFGKVFRYAADVDLGRDHERPSWGDIWNDMGILWDGTYRESKSDYLAAMNYFSLALEEIIFTDTGEYSEMYEIKKAIASDDSDALELALLRGYQSRSIVDENGEPEGKEFYELLWTIHGPSFPMVVLPSNEDGIDMNVEVGPYTLGPNSIETGTGDFGDQGIIGVTTGTALGTSTFTYVYGASDTFGDAVKVSSKHPATYLVTPAIHAVELSVALPLMRGNERRLLDWDRLKFSEPEEEVEEESEGEVPDEQDQDFDVPPLPVLPEPDFSKPDIPFTGLTLAAFASLVALYGFSKAVEMVHQNGQDLPGGWWKFDPSLIEGIHYDSDDDDVEDVTEDAPEENPYKGPYQRSEEILPEEANPEAFILSSEEE